MQQRRFTVTIAFNQLQAEQIGSLAADIGAPVAAVVKLAAVRGLGQVTPRTLEEAQQAGEVRTTGVRRPWPGLSDDKSKSSQKRRSSKGAP